MKTKYLLNGSWWRKAVTMSDDHADHVFRYYWNNVIQGQAGAHSRGFFQRGAGTPFRNFVTDFLQNKTSKAYYSTLGPEVGSGGSKAILFEGQVSTSYLRNIDDLPVSPRFTDEQIIYVSAAFYAEDIPNNSKINLFDWATVYCDAR